MNKVGKVLTVFLVIFTVLLVSLTAISMFFFQKELERRKAAEELLEQIKGREVKLDGELTEAKKQIDSHSRPGDVILIMGAGDVYKLTENFV